MTNLPLSTIAGIIVAGGVLALTYLIMIILSPELSERYGRRLIAHSQALRDYRALHSLALRTYRATLRDISKELKEVMY